MGRKSHATPPPPKRIVEPAQDHGRGRTPPPPRKAGQKDWPEISRSLDAAQELRADRKAPVVVYRRAGKVAHLLLSVYLAADLDAKGAKRIAVIGGIR